MSRDGRFRVGAVVGGVGHGRAKRREWKREILSLRFCYERRAGGEVGTNEVKRGREGKVELRGGRRGCALSPGGLDPGSVGDPSC